MRPLIAIGMLEIELMILFHFNEIVRKTMKTVNIMK